MIAMLKDILEARGAVSKGQAEIKTACRGSKLATIAEMWNDGVYTLKKGHSSTTKMFGAYCEGSRLKGCCARPLHGSHEF